MDPFTETMTATVADRFVRIARKRRFERRGAWRCALNNLSSGVESRHALKVTSSGILSGNSFAGDGGPPLNCLIPRAHGEEVRSLWLGEGVEGCPVVTTEGTQLAGVAPGLLNNFRPATTAKSEDVSCVVSTSDAASCEGSQGGANSASPSGDSVRGNATA